MKKLFTLALAAFFLFVGSLRADEGMWIPMLLSKYNIANMQAKGLKLSAEDIYSVNQASLKDAIVIFGGGCTGELISDKGLLITNHHCGFRQIQQHSSTEHDYLTNGFWAMNQGEELTNPGLKVTFLVRMDDVTERILGVITKKMSEADRNNAINAEIRKITAEATQGNHYQASVKPFFSGNQYFMFVQEVFTDVRLVGAPPSAIGKFGGDTDNWMWPRHTGDFSIFRIYANKEGKPATYSEENVPLKPKKHFPISLKGVKKGDFTMVFGYPGSTQEYIPSFAIDMYQNVEYPHRIALRKQKLDIINAAMNADPAVRIQYAAKQAGIANSWKKWIGVIRGLKRLDAINKKQAFETEFDQWVSTTEEYQMAYGKLLSDYEKLYKEYSKYNLAYAYFIETAYYQDVLRFARSVQKHTGGMQPSEKIQENLRASAKGFYKDYHQPTDKAIFAAMIKAYYENMEAEFKPEFFGYVTSKFNNDFEAFAEDIYTRSVLVDADKFEKAVLAYNTTDADVFKNDPMLNIYSEFLDTYRSKTATKLDGFREELRLLDRLYMRAQMEMDSERVFYPDANFTLRLTYGQVDDYRPRNAVHYDYYSTLKGIMEKDNPEIYDYDVPDQLRVLFDEKDYGQFGENGEMHVCFIASNHTSGGNSGSPVINGNGELIGVNFDRNWEGTMSDIMYDPSQCRNITLDIRYALFIIDKFAGAGWLLDEMTLVK